MGIWDWISQNWINLFGSAGIAGLYIAGIALRADTKARQDANILAITASHRELWTLFLNDKGIARVRDVHANIHDEPISQDEWIFTTLVISHIGSVFYTQRNGMLIQLEGLQRDIGEFFSLPIPREVWGKTKKYQNKDFADFVKSCRELN